jgi:dTDP-4-dehydrorhamnose 3,5-epimerase
MKESQINKALELIKKAGGKIIVFSDENQNGNVILGLDEYEILVNIGVQPEAQPAHQIQKPIEQIDGVIIKNLKKFEDERGWLAEIYREDETTYKPVMSYISVTNPGVARGPHEHQNQADCFVFVGPGNFELYLWDRRSDSQTTGNYVKMTVGEESPTLVIVPPGVVHGYKCIGDKVAYSINFPDKLYKGSGKSEEIDEIRWEQDPNSPYKI